MPGKSAGLHWGVRSVAFAMIASAPVLVASSYDLLVGALLDYRSISLYDRQYEQEVARLETGRFKPAPSLSLRTAPRYFFQSENWAYTFAVDVSTSTLDKQRYVDESSSREVLADTGTRIDGVTLFVTPLLYYQFNRHDRNRWQYRAGGGMGVGYQYYHGTARILRPEHPDDGTVVAINHSGANLSAGLYLEASYRRHHIIFEGNLLATTDAHYRYLENSVGFTYLYRIISFSFD